jgi:hypothetical protein
MYPLEDGSEPQEVLLCRPRTEVHFAVTSDNSVMVALCAVIRPIIAVTEMKLAWVGADLFELIVDIGEKGPSLGMIVRKRRLIPPSPSPN